MPWPIFDAAVTSCCAMCRGTYSRGDGGNCTSGVPAASAGGAGRALLSDAPAAAGAAVTLVEGTTLGTKVSGTTTSGGSGFRGSSVMSTPVHRQMSNSPGGPG